MDTEWILDSTFTLGRLTPLEYTTCRLHRQAYWQVRNAVDHDQAVDDDFMLNAAVRVLQRAPDDDRFYLSLLSLEALPFGLKGVRERAECIVRQKLLDDLWPADPDLPQQPLERFRALEPRIFDAAAPVTRDQVEAVIARSIGPMLGRLDNDLTLLMEAAAWYRADDGARFRAICGRPDGPFLPAPRRVCHQAGANAVWQRLEAQELRALQRRARDTRRQARGPIRRCVRLFERLGRRDDLAIFVRGGALEIRHPSSCFKFVVTPSRKRGWLIDYTAHPAGHTPFDLSLYTHDHVFLAHLCVLPADTPVLDQVLALMLFVESGHELELLQKANWQGMAAAAVVEQAVLPVYPQLRDKLPGAPARRLREIEAKVTLPRAFVEAERRWQPYAKQVDDWIDALLAPYSRLSQQAAALLPAALQREPAGERHAPTSQEMV